MIKSNNIPVTHPPTPFPISKWQTSSADIHTPKILHVQARTCPVAVKKKTPATWKCSENVKKRARKWNTQQRRRKPIQKINFVVYVLYRSLRFAANARGLLSHRWWSFCCCCCCRYTGYVVAVVFIAVCKWVRLESNGTRFKMEIYTQFEGRGAFTKR